MPTPSKTVQRQILISCGAFFVGALAGLAAALMPTAAGRAAILLCLVIAVAIYAWRSDEASPGTQMIEAGLAALGAICAVLAGALYPALARDGWSLSGVLRGDAPERRADGRSFTILQLNDAYRIEGLDGGKVGGLARVRTLRAELEAAGRDVLVLHAGDFLFPSVMSRYRGGDAMIRTLNLLDGDPTAFDPRLVVTFGNHEFERDDPGEILGRLAQSDFSWVSANVRYKSAPTAEPQPFSDRARSASEVRVVEVGGVRVGIFGLTLDDEKQPYLAYASADPARRAAVRAALMQLQKQGAEVVIALTHQDARDDVRLMEEFPGVHLVVGGHDHANLLRRVRSSLLTKADADARTVYVIDVDVGRDGRVSATASLRPLDESVPEDPAVKSQVDEQMAMLEKAVAKSRRWKTGEKLSDGLYRSESCLRGAESAIRTRETGLGNLIADSIAAGMKTQVALVNGGAVRMNDDIAPGEWITRGQLEGMFYYDEPLVRIELAGNRLREVLERSLLACENGQGSFLQVSGVQLDYTRVDGRCVIGSDVRVRITEGPGSGGVFERIRDDARYSVGTLEYLVTQGSDPALRAAGVPPGDVEQQPVSRETFENYLKETFPTEDGKPVVSVKINDRLRDVTPGTVVDDCAR